MFVKGRRANTSTQNPCGTIVSTSTKERCARSVAGLLVLQPTVRHAALAEGSHAPRLQKESVHCNHRGIELETIVANTFGRARVPVLEMPLHYLHKKKCPGHQVRKRDAKEIEGQVARTSERAIRVRSMPESRRSEKSLTKHMPNA